MLQEVSDRTVTIIKVIAFAKLTDLWRGNARGSAGANKPPTNSPRTANEPAMKLSPPSGRMKSQVRVGDAVGPGVGFGDVGDAVGFAVGFAVGLAIGLAVGMAVGMAVGPTVGLEVGLGVVGAEVLGAGVVGGAPQLNP